MADYIDASAHQGNMNFNITKANGVKGIALRGGYHIYRDIKFDEFYQNAVDCGYIPGVYLFTISHYKSVSGNYQKAIDVLDKELSVLFTTLKGKKTEFVALDLELEKGEENCLSKKEMTLLANYFVDKMTKSGYIPRTYCSISWLFDFMIPNDINCDFWIAYYYEDTEKSKFPPTKWGELMNKVKDRIKLWQFSESGNGKIYGATSPTIDLNYNYAESHETPDEEKPVPTPTPTPSKGFTVGEKVKLDGYLYADSWGNDRGQKRTNTIHTITKIVDISRNAPYLLDNGLGWVKGADIKAVYAEKPVDSVIKKGDIVTVKKGAKTYDNKNLASWVNDNKTKFHVLEKPVGNRVVIGNSKGEVTAAMRMEDLIK